MASDDINVRADLPPSVHPDVLSPLATALDQPGTAGRSAYNAGRIALEDLRKSYAAIHDAERSLRAAASPNADIRMGPDGLHQHTGRDEELSGAAERAFNRTAKVVDLRMAEMKAHASILEGNVADALKDPRGTAADGIAIAQEVRGHLRSLPDAERFAFIRKAIESDDRRSVAAVLAAPSFLSGLAPASQAMVRDLAARRWAPVDHAQAQAVAKAIERVTTASKVIVGRYSRVLKLADGPGGRATRAIGKLADG
ncbi:hypothetical protein [Reyranella sp.]|uniref:hypothetical protein n=1 Tax=Reyranella sp. TaxID=1929291 RepID=UPI0027318618|nr:hypothetical protein [Reyranella sp.]MDP2374270.1 hypothetical protein [Reyranella sp.]